MNFGLFGKSVRFLLSVSAVCVGLGAMGVDVVGMMGLSADMVMFARYVIGGLGVVSLYAFVMTCCSDCGSCK